MMRRCEWAVPAFLLGLLVQPGAFLGCSSDAGGGYDFGKTELLDVVDRANEIRSWAFESSGQQYTLKVNLYDASNDAPADEKRRPHSMSLLLRPAHACETHVRTFNSVASACSDEYQTELPISGIVKVYRRGEGVESLIYERSVEGIVEVFGRRLGDAVNLRIHLSAEALEVGLVRAAPTDDFQLDHFRDPSIGISSPVGGTSER